MNKTKTRLIYEVLFIILIASIALIITDNIDALAFWAKLAIPSLILLIAIWNICRFFFPPKPKQEKPEASDEEKKDTKKKSKPFDWGKLIIVLVILGIPGTLTYWMIFDGGGDAINNVLQPNNTPAQPTIFFKHNEDQVSVKKFDKWLNDTKVHDIFYLEENQYWDWEFSKDILYRIKVTGNETFSILPRKKWSGVRFSADRAGTLQIKSKKAKNHVRVKKLEHFKS